jgi:hypothetical protein
MCMHSLDLDLSVHESRTTSLEAALVVQRIKGAKQKLKNKDS